MGSLASFIVFITVAVGFNLTKGLYEEGEQNLKKKSANKEFQDAIYHCLKNYSNFEGKTNRSNFWYFFIFTLVGSLFYQTVDWYTNLTEYFTTGKVWTKENSILFDYIKNNLSWSDVWILPTIFDLIMIIPGLAVGARRLHDVGKSGWWQLLMITIIGFIPLIYWWASPATNNLSKSSSAKNSKNKISDDLRELKKLYDDKVISKSEFTKAKKKLLDK